MLQECVRRSRPILSAACLTMAFLLVNPVTGRQAEEAVYASAVSLPTL